MDSESVPAATLAPLIVRVAAAGKELTDVGLMLQLPAPDVVAQLKITVPLNPSCAATESCAVVPMLLPTLNSGAPDGPVRMKSGLEVTFTVNDCDSVVEVPAVLAWTVTG